MVINEILSQLRDKYLNHPNEIKKYFIGSEIKFTSSQLQQMTLCDYIDLIAELAKETWVSLYLSDSNGLDNVSTNNVILAHAGYDVELNDTQTIAITINEFILD